MLQGDCWTLFAFVVWTNLSNEWTERLKLWSEHCLEMVGILKLLVLASQCHHHSSGVFHLWNRPGLGNLVFDMFVGLGRDYPPKILISILSIFLPFMILAFAQCLQEVLEVALPS